jgi:hypothetical protein
VDPETGEFASNDAATTAAELLNLPPDRRPNR